MLSRVLPKLGMGLVLLLLPGVVQGNGPDGEYLAVYEQLQAADQTAAQGDSAAARARFLEVQAQLIAFQRAYPTWHPEIVDFRLRHVQQRLRALEPAAEPDAAPSPGTPDMVDPETLWLRMLEARVRQLELEREELQTRLREALAHSPAVADSPELRRAEERIRLQQKEIDLLRYTVQAERENQRSVSQPTPAGRTEEDLRARLAAVEAELQLERTRSSVLQTAAAELQGQLRALQSVHDAPVLPPTAFPTSDTPFTDEVSSDLELGRSLVAAGRMDEALPLLGRAAEATPESSEILALLGQVLWAKGLPDAAEAVWHRAVRLDDRSLEAHLGLARLSLGRSPPDAGSAERHYQAARRAGLGSDPELESLIAAAATRANSDRPR